MAGISSALNIAKNALLAFQTAVHVTSHNVANVDTEGYSRQKVVATPFPPSPSPVGPIGSGVKIDQIKRYFDAFLEANLNLKRTALGLFTAEETGMRLVETIFNETQELGLTTLLNDFFAAWQTLSNRPEGLPERRLVVEKGKLLAENIADKFQALRDLENNIGVKLQSIIEKINSLAQQIAEINLQITTAEIGGHQANDLRDQRDRLIAELSQLAPIRYFENKDGAYNVILGKGFNLVDVDRAWELEISGTEVYWLGHQGERARLTSKEIEGGELGGWLRILEQISDEWNHEYVSSTKAVVRPDGLLITEDTTFRDLNILPGETFEFYGTDHFGNTVTGSYTVTDDLKTVRELLDEIERAFGFTVTVYLRDGRLFIRDAHRGSGELSFGFARTPLDFGRFDDEGLNYRVEELNLAGKLSAFAEELIRAVNRTHTEGVGLKFFTGELEGLYQTADYIKNLPFFLDLNREGGFFLWIKSPSGELTPVRVDFELPADALLEDVASQINAALEAKGFDPPRSVQAVVRNGRLVFQAQEGWAFAFSNDTSGILASTGINVFFAGLDAASIEVNPYLSVHPEYVAAAKLDREAWRSALSVAGPYRSLNPIPDPTTVAFTDPDHTLYVRFFDARGQVLNETSVEVLSGDTLADILEKLDTLEGLRAYRDPDGYLVLALDPNYSGGYAYFELGVADPETTGSFLAYLRDQGVWVPQYVYGGGQIFSGLEPITQPQQYIGDIEGRDPASLVFTGSLTVRFYDENGQEVGQRTFTPTDTNGNGWVDLEDLITTLDGSTELKAYIDHGEVVIALENPPAGTSYFVLEEDDTARSWGRIKLDDGGTPYELTFVMGVLENWLYDAQGDPIDTDENNRVVDPFRIFLATDSGVTQILKDYNAVENARFGLEAELDSAGRLLVSLSGLYDTRSFVVTDAFRGESFSRTLESNHFDASENRWFLLTDLPVEGTASFEAQNITVVYRDADGNPVTSQTISLAAGDTLNDFLAALNGLDMDGDGEADFEASIDSSGRLRIRVADPDQDNDGRPDWVRFSLESDLAGETGNLVTYLARRIWQARKGLSYVLQGFDLQPGDNRNALRVAELSDSRREALGEASLYDYYSAVVGEIGVAGKRVTDARTFMEDLIKQLQLMRDSISAVSLDEEMANLMKYQQAFAAAAKVLTAADEMLMTLIEAKR